MSDKTPIENAEITSAPEAKRKRPKPARRTADLAQPVVPARLDLVDEYLAGASLRSIARKCGMSRSAVESMCRREGWARLREAARERAARRLVERAARKLEAIESAGLDARLLTLNRAKRSLKRRKLPGAEMEALRDVSTAIKNTDLISEKHRALGVQVNTQINMPDLATALAESRKYEILPPA
jgi:AraC-like DNA-binding protein